MFLPFLYFFFATEGRVSVPKRDNMEFQSGLSEGEGTNGSTANGTNAGLTTPLTIQSAFQELSSSEQDEFMARLYDDEENMKLLFGSLVTATCYSAQKNVSIGIFRASILALGAYEPVPGERDRSLLDEHRNEIKAAESIADIFTILAPYWNYLSYEILKYVIKEHGTSDDRGRLKDYKEKLNIFCKRRIFEVPLLESGSDTSNTCPNQVEFVVKFDKPEDITVKEFRQIRKQIAKVLHVKVAAFKICRVDVGCVQLTFLIPKFVAQEIFPLSHEQTSALSKDASVIRLECGVYVFEV